MKDLTKNFRYRWNPIFNSESMEISNGTIRDLTERDPFDLTTVPTMVAILDGNIMVNIHG